MKKALLFIFLFFFFFFRSPLYASTNFDTSYNVSYNVRDNQKTTVALDITLKNRTSDYYASSYSVQTGFKDIENIHATDSSGNLTYSVKKENDGTSILFKFNKNIVGINNSQKFTVSFDTGEVAKDNGSIHEVNIPGISDQSSYQSFNVLVNVPEKFGKASIIKPLVRILKQDGNTLQFDKNDLGNSGISIAYGDNQIYDFNLTYHLYNRNLFPVTGEIAIPSNNNYQEIQLSNVSPKPTDVYVDSDGNWLAKYKLSAGKTLDVVVAGKAKVAYKPRKEYLSESRKQIYLRPQKYWNVNDPKVMELAKTLKTPEQIYEYVVNNLKYDAKRVKNEQVRAGGAEVLKNKSSAVCLEFTDLFISIARAAGIPTREVEGWGNTNNSADRPLSAFKDVLHTWPEYYDFKQSAWIMVDPTWGNTTGGLDFFNVFDFDHLAFVVNGEDSTYPIPAGGYKLPGEENIQDVTVITSATFEKTNPKLLATAEFSKAYLSGFPIEGNIVVRNNSGVLAPNQTINVSSNNLYPTSQDLYFDSIPPYGEKTIPVKFLRKSFLTKEEDLVKITIGKDSITSKLLVLPFYQHVYFYFLLGGILVGGVIIFLSVVARKSRNIQIS